MMRTQRMGQTPSQTVRRVAREESGRVSRLEREGCVHQRAGAAAAAVGAEQSAVSEVGRRGAPSAARCKLLFRSCWRGQWGCGWPGAGRGRVVQGSEPALGGMGVRMRKRQCRMRGAGGAGGVKALMATGGAVMADRRWCGNLMMRLQARTARSGGEAAAGRRAQSRAGPSTTTTAAASRGALGLMCARRRPRRRDGPWRRCLRLRALDALASRMQAAAVAAAGASVRECCSFQ